jgi:hypothetical protein
VTVWDAVQVSAASKRQLLELFVLRVPVYRQRFQPLASAPTAERFYRIAQACCALVQELRLNHRHEYLYARLYKLLRHTPLDDVPPHLGPDSLGITLESPSAGMPSGGTSPMEHIHAPQYRRRSVAAVLFPLHPWQVH